MAPSPAAAGITRAPTRTRLAAALLGPRAARRLTLTHALDDVGDSLLNLSLVGSLFFNVSIDASRSRILLYLVLTAAPLVVVAPVVGPILDRARAGYRSVVLVSQVARALLAVALAGSLLSLAFYPIVFGVLLARKAYALAKTGLLAELVVERHDLVRASGHIARTGTVAGGAGTAMGGVLLASGDVSWLPLTASAMYVAAVLVTSGLPRSERRSAVAAAVVRSETPQQVRIAAAGVLALRAAAGALTFLLALAIKRGGGDAWIFAAALVGAGVGSFLGTIVSPRLHRSLSSDRVVLAAIIVPGAVSGFGVLTIGSASIVVIAGTIGLAGSVASRSMDTLYATVPDLVRGRVIARTELHFQMANLGGAIAAVSSAPSPRVGFGVVAAVLLLGGVGTASAMRVSIRHEAGRWLLGSGADQRWHDGTNLGRAALAEALHHAEAGRFRLAVLFAEAAVRASASGPGPAVPWSATWLELGTSIDDVVAGRSEADATYAMDVIGVAEAEVAAHESVRSPTGVSAAADQSEPSSVPPSDGTDSCSGSSASAQPSSS